MQKYAPRTMNKAQQHALARLWRARFIHEMNYRGLRRSCYYSYFMGAWRVAGLFYITKDGVLVP